MTARDAATAGAKAIELFSIERAQEFRVVVTKVTKGKERASEA